MPSKKYRVTNKLQRNWSDPKSGTIIGGYKTVENIPQGVIESKYFIRGKAKGYIVIEEMEPKKAEKKEDDSKLEATKKEKTSKKDTDSKVKEKKDA